MSISCGPDLSEYGLVLSVDNTNSKSWKGKPTTNTYTGLSVFNGLTGTYLGKDSDGWEKYSLSGTWNSGSYPYSMSIMSSGTFLGNTAYSASIEIKTSCPQKFASWGGINYVNDPNMVSGGAQSVVTVDDYQIRKNEGFIYSAGYAGAGGTSQVGYLVSQPVNNGTTFDPSTDFVYIRNAQIEQSSFCTQYTAGVRSNTQALLDLTGNTTLTANSLTYGVDKSFSFNGSSDRITLTNFPNRPSAAITCTSWCYPTRAPSIGTIRGATISCSSSLYLGLINSVDGGVSHALHWAIQTSTGRPTSFSGSIPQNKWSYIVGTYDGSTSRAYINGVEVWSSAASGTLTDGTYYIGTYGPGAGDGVHDWLGSISRAQIYNRALSPTEITQIFNTQRGKYGV